MNGAKSMAVEEDIVNRRGILRTLTISIILASGLGSTTPAVASDQDRGGRCVGEWN